MNKQNIDEFLESLSVLTDRLGIKLVADDLRIYDVELPGKRGFLNNIQFDVYTGNYKPTDQYGDFISTRR